MSESKDRSEYPLYSLSPEGEIRKVMSTVPPWDALRKIERLADGQIPAPPSTGDSTFWEIREIARDALELVGAL